MWDFWLADDGERYHLFFLFASRALHDPDARHFRASIGHAVSTDLATWTRVADAVVRGPEGAFDDLATWTGSVVEGPDGRWHLFYTGATLGDGGRSVQTIGVATSDDLMTWHKSPDNPVLRADGRWYETLAETDWFDEAFRDPWVYPDPDGDGWHMLITARATEGELRGRGVVGHAVSPDLEHWELRPPLSRPVATGFGQLEVMQTAVIEGRAVLLFSCLRAEASDAVRAEHPRGAVWAVPADAVTGPFDIAAASPLAEDEVYVGRVIRRRSDDRWVFLAFRLQDQDGRFVGGVTDPVPVGWRGERLVLLPD